MLQFNEYISLAPITEHFVAISQIEGYESFTKRCEN